MEQINKVAVVAMPLNRKDQSERKKSEGYQMSVLIEFINLKPPAFEGHSDPLAAERWLEAVKAMLDSLGVAKDFRVQFATYLFDGPAEDWWDLKADSADLNWEEFETLFRETYAPETLKHEMIAELKHLAQWATTVSQYHTRFVELCSYDPLMVADPVSKCAKFRRGLSRRIKSRLAPFTFTVLSDLVNAAQSVETYLEQKMDGTNRRDHRIQQGNESSTTPSKGLYGCYHCGEVGHQRCNCPLKKTQSAGRKSRVVTKNPRNSLGIHGKSKTKASSSNSFPSRGLGQAGHGRGKQSKQSKSSVAVSGGKLPLQSGSSSKSRTTTCHLCGAVGHKRRFCPRQQVGSAVSVGGQPRDQSGSVFEGARMIQPQPSTLYTPLQSPGYHPRYRPQSSVFQLNQNVPSSYSHGFYPRIGGPSFNSG